MARQDTFFYLSGLISLTLFTFFLLLFMNMLFSSSNIKSYALKKDDYISISVSMSALDIKSAKKNLTIPVIETKKIEKPKAEASSVIDPQDVDIDNLFSDVWTKDIKKQEVKEKKIDAKRLQQIQKRIKTTQKNEVEEISKKVTDMGSYTKEEEKSSASTSDEVNEYLAKIQALVYDYFSPPQNSQGHSVKAVISISAIGKVQDFRILQLSSNMALNKECEKIKDRLMTVLFPINPQNKSGNYIVILTSKE